MGLLSRLFNSWAVKRQRKEMQEFIDGLRSMDAQEVGFVVATTTHMRNILESEGMRLMDPLVDYPLDPTITLRLGKIIREFQKVGDNTDAAGAMVWLHTMRVGGRHELRQLGRDMWRELARGIPHAEGASLEIMRMTFKPCRIEGFERYPLGLSPEPSR